MPHLDLEPLAHLFGIPDDAKRVRFSSTARAALVSLSPHYGRGKASLPTRVEPRKDGTWFAFPAGSEDPPAQAPNSGGLLLACMRVLE